MMITPDAISRALDRALPTVQKPARYTGGEYNSIVKPWDEIAYRLALVFPDVYDLGMSNLGLAVLYDIVNRQPDMLAERAYTPWVDMIAAMRREAIPLYSLETRHALADFDVLGFTLPYEQLYTNVLTTLDLARIPLRAADRDDAAPLILAGGSACLNPEPMYAFFDAFFIGEGEEAIVEIVRAWKDARRARPQPPRRVGSARADRGRVCAVAVRNELSRGWEDCGFWIADYSPRSAAERDSDSPRWKPQSAIPNPQSAIL